MNNVKQALFSENGMKLVNVLFIASVLIRNNGISLAAYAFWIVYLLYCVRHSPSKTVQIIFKLFIVFAAFMISLNLYSMLRRIWYK